MGITCWGCWRSSSTAAGTRAFDGILTRNHHDARLEKQMAMSRQPDFEKLFFEHAGATLRKANYSVRADSNRCHDLVFLGSMIHDATTTRASFRLRKERLTIRMDRFAREYKPIEHADCIEYYESQSRLSIAPVTNLEWRFAFDLEISPNDPIFLNGVEIRRHECCQATDTIAVMVDGLGWSLHMRAKSQNLQITLRDLEVPHLYPDPAKAGREAPPRA